MSNDSDYDDDDDSSNNSSNPFVKAQNPPERWAIICRQSNMPTKEQTDYAINAYINNIPKFIQRSVIK